MSTGLGVREMRPLVSTAALQYSDLRLAPSLLWISDFSSVKWEAGVSRTVNGVIRMLVKDPKLLSETKESLLLTQIAIAQGSAFSCPGSLGPNLHRVM